VTGPRGVPPAGELEAPERPALDTSRPNIARMYDYWLGGKDNYAADREAAEELLRLIPESILACRHNRLFLQRAVQFLTTEAGIGQFIDIGTGLPTQNNVHEMAPDARVVYVDNDPVVIAHANALLVKRATVRAIRGDLRQPRDILADPGLQELIDLGEPVAILLVAIVHFVDDEEEPYRIADALKAAMAPGSYLVISHVTADEIPAAISQDAQRVYRGASAAVTPRSRAQVERFFDGLDLVDPGVVETSAWRPKLSLPSPGRVLSYAGMARKP